MLILSIDTSGSHGSIALSEGARLLLTRSLNTQQQHAQRLVVELEQLFHESGRTLSELNLIAVSLGPGSFTGVRVGVVCAKTLAFVHQCPVIGVDTLQAWALSSLAERTDHVDGILWVVENAQRGDLFAGAYRCSGSGPCEPVQPVSLLSASEFLRRVGPVDFVLGPGIAIVSEQLPTERVWPARHDLSQPTGSTLEGLPLASAVARIGFQEFQRRGGDDVRLLEPRYLRLSAAEEKWLARQGGAAPAAVP